MSSIKDRMKMFEPKNESKFENTKKNEEENNFSNYKNNKSSENQNDNNPIQKKTSLQDRIKIFQNPSNNNSSSTKTQL